jgi:hypothetical protein
MQVGLFWNNYHYFFKPLLHILARVINVRPDIVNYYEK